MQEYTHIDHSSSGGNLSKVIEDPHNSILNLADRDVPILIGALVGVYLGYNSYIKSELNLIIFFELAGAVGLVFLIFTAILFWLCCQQANRKNLYTDRGESASSDEEPGPTNEVQQSTNFAGSVPRLDRVMLIKKNSYLIGRDPAFDFRSFSASGPSLTHYRPNSFPVKQISLG